MGNNSRSSSESSINSCRNSGVLVILVAATEVVVFIAVKVGPILLIVKPEIPNILFTMYQDLRDLMLFFNHSYR